MNNYSRLTFHVLIIDNVGKIISWTGKENKYKSKLTSIDKKHSLGMKRQREK